MKIREALDIIKCSMNEKVKHRRTKEYQAFKTTEDKLFPDERVTEEDIERIINEVMAQGF